MFTFSKNWVHTADAYTDKWGCAKGPGNDNSFIYSGRLLNPWHDFAQTQLAPFLIFPRQNAKVGTAKQTSHGQSAHG